MHFQKDTLHLCQAAELATDTVGDILHRLKSCSEELSQLNFPYKANICDILRPVCETSHEAEKRLLALHQQQLQQAVQDQDGEVVSIQDIV